MTMLLNDSCIGRVNGAMVNMTLGQGGLGFEAVLLDWSKFQHFCEI